MGLPLASEANAMTFRDYVLFFFDQPSVVAWVNCRAICIWWMTPEIGSTPDLAVASVAGFAPLVLSALIISVLSSCYTKVALHIQAPKKQ